MMARILPQAPLPPALSTTRSTRLWKRKARRSLNLVVAEGATDRSAYAISDNFSVPFGLVMGAGLGQIGMLVALPRLVAALAQLAAPGAIKLLGSYRRVMYLAALASAGAFGGIAATPLLPEGARVWALIALVVLGVALLDFDGPALGCWVSEQVPVKKRGRYMACRQTLGAVVVIGVLLAGGPFLDAMAGRVVLGLVVVFGVAAALRLLAAALLFRVVERGTWAASVAQPTLSAMVATLRSANLGRFLAFSFLFHFGVFLAGPFFIPYQLRELGFSYAGLLVPSVVAALSGLVGLQVAGRAAARGNLRVLRLSMVVMPLLPFAWLWVSTPTHVAMVNVVGGAAWSAFNLCSMLHVYQISTARDRANNVAFLLLSNGVAIFLGVSVGTLVFDHLPELLGSLYLSVFALSGGVRVLAVAMLWLFVKECDARRPGAETADGPCGVWLPNPIRGSCGVWLLNPVRRAHHVWQPMGARRRVLRRLAAQSRAQLVRRPAAHGSPGRLAARSAGRCDGAAAQRGRPSGRTPGVRGRYSRRAAWEKLLS